MYLVYVANRFSSDIPYIVDRAKLISSLYSKSIIITGFTDIVTEDENMEIITVPIKNYLPQDVLSINGVLQSYRYKFVIEKLKLVDESIHLVFATWGDFNFGLISCLKKANLTFNRTTSMLIGNYSKRYLQKGFFSINKRMLLNQLNYSNDVIYFDPRMKSMLNINGITAHSQFLFGSRITANMFDCRSDRKQKIVWVGRKVEEKGLSILKDAIKIHKDFLFLVIGSGSIDGIQSSNLRDIPWMDRNQLDMVMRDSFALLFTSRSEGLPNVVLDSMALGLPVLTTDAGALRGILEHKVNSYIHNGSISEINEGIEWLRIKQNRDEISYNAQELIFEKLNYNEALKSWSKRYFENSNL